MSESKPLESRTAWVERVLGVRIKATGDALRDRFDLDLSALERERLEHVRDAVPAAAQRVADTVFPRLLASSLDELSEAERQLGKQLPLPDLRNPDQQLTLAYDVVDALQANWLNTVPIDTFREVILGQPDKAVEWAKSFNDWIDTQQADIKAVTDALVERRYLAPARTAVRASAAQDKLLKSAQQGGFPEAEAFAAMLGEALRDCPVLAEHLGRILGDPAKNVSIFFSDKAKDALFSKEGGGDAPPNVIVLPKQGKSIVDLLDGLVFESCNAEIQDLFDTLDNDRNVSLRGTGVRNADPPSDPMPLQDYGRRKADVEAGTTIKHVQLVYAAAKAGVPMAYQGKRNTLAMLQTMLEMGDGGLQNYQEVLESEELLDDVLREHDLALGEFLGSLDSNPQARQAVLDKMASTPHNRNATEPGDSGQLCTSALYAFEATEVTLRAPQITGMVLSELNKGGIPKQMLSQLRLPIQKLIQICDLGVLNGEPEDAKVDRRPRNATILQIVNTLKQYWPNLDFACLNFTEEMAEVATARLEDSKRENAARWEKADVELSFTEAWRNLERVLGPPPQL